jgi:hypothetical protein
MRVHKSMYVLLLTSLVNAPLEPIEAQEPSAAVRPSTSPVDRCLALVNQASQRMARVSETIRSLSCVTSNPPPHAESTQEVGGPFSSYVAGEAKKVLQTVACPASTIVVDVIPPKTLRIKGRIRKGGTVNDSVGDLRRRLVGIEVDAANLQEAAACGTPFGEGFQLISKPDGGKWYRLMEIEPAVQNLLPTKDECPDIGQKLNDLLRREAGSGGARFWVRMGPGDLTLCLHGKRVWLPDDSRRYEQTGLVVLSDR